MTFELEKQVPNSDDLMAKGIFNAAGPTVMHGGSLGLSHGPLRQPLIFRQDGGARLRLVPDLEQIVVHLHIRPKTMNKGELMIPPSPPPRNGFGGTPRDFIKEREQKEKETNGFMPFMS